MKNTMRSSAMRAARQSVQGMDWRERTPFALLVALAALAAQPAAAAPGASLVTAPVHVVAEGARYAAEGTVEAVRYSPLAAQVQAIVTDVRVKAGERVRAGQVLLRLDARAAGQIANSGAAQAEAAQATLNVARRDYERQKLLREKEYISQAAFDRAEAQYKAAAAQSEAQIAQASAMRTQAGYYTLTAPYDGIVADQPVSVGDMAMPGRVLVTVYDPAAIRVSASVPESVAAGIDKAEADVELPGASAADTRRFRALPLRVLPAADPATHSVVVQASLPAKAGNLTPGTFARLLLPLRQTREQRLFVPSTAVIRRTDMSAVYVLDQGKPQLRQVRTGRDDGAETEVLSGVAAGERVYIDPAAASRAQ